jgi:thymidylate synthase
MKKNKDKIMNTLDKKYTDLLQDILDNGTPKQTRNGKVLSVFGRQIRHSMSEGFPLLTTKKMYFKGIVTELLWFLRGDTSIEYLLENDCNIWTGDAYKNYCNKVDIKSIEDTLGAKARHHTLEEFIERIKTDDEFAKQWCELGPIYGKQWRKWRGKLVDKSEELNVHTAWVPEQIDQIANLINDLKTNPDSRRLMVSAWNVGELDSMVLPPCHYGFQVYTRELSLKERFELWEKIPTRNVMDFPIGQLTDEQYHDALDKIGVQRRAISLMWNQRSVDTPLGLPFNIASYGLLLEIIAKAVNMVPDELIGNLGDCHIYTNQIDGVKKQLTREPFELPTLKMNPIFLANLEHKGLDEAINGQVNFELENHQSHPAIKMPLSN